MNDLREILYCSLLATNQPTRAVGQIVTVARARNAVDEITGLLVFDGMRFWQHVEGPGDKVADLMARLEADPRHLEIRVLYAGVLAQRRYRRFEMGLAQIEDGDDMAAMRDLEGLAALEYFLALRTRFDIAG